MSKIKNFFHGINLYVNASNMIAHYPDIKSEEHKVNLYDYHPEKANYYRHNDTRWNLGDSLGNVISSWMLDKKNLSFSTEVKKKKFLNTVGSNIFQSYQNTTIWGSGVMYEPQSSWKYLSYYPFRKLDVRAVRGPLSREVIMNFGHSCPEVYGDPAILMPLIYQPNFEGGVKRDVLVVPQFIAEKEIRNDNQDFDMISMNTNDYKFVIDEIVSSKLVVTSSLHAVILAEVYGVPAVLFRSLNKVVDFKYHDYYESTGRTVHIADTLNEALSIQPLPIPDFSQLQQGLLDSFPYDLWLDNM